MSLICMVFFCIYPNSPKYLCICLFTYLNGSRTEAEEQAETKAETGRGECKKRHKKRNKEEEKVKRRQGKEKGEREKDYFCAVVHSPDAHSSQHERCLK